MITVEEALARILAGVEPLPAEWISVREAAGRVLAEAVVSRRTSPPFDQSAMDGYAVRAEDVASAGAELEVVTGESAAGHAASERVGAGRALRIFTGARMPEGADAVVIQEDVEVIGERRIRVRVAAKPGAWVRSCGMDVREGQPIFAPGLTLAPRHVAIIAGVDCPWVRVYRKPRVGVLATGDELAHPGDPIGAEQIVVSSTYALLAYVEAWGGEAIDLGIARDDRESLLAAAKGAAGLDLLITTGGASVGDHDLIRSVLGEGGLKVDFWKIAMRPGKPLIFGHFAKTPFLGLPGNPVSSLVCAWLFLRPALARMTGRGDVKAPIVRARLGKGLPANDKRQDYLRAELQRAGDSGEMVATPFEVQDSAMLFTFARADGLVIRAPNAPAAAAGELADVLVLDERAL